MTSTGTQFPDLGTMLQTTPGTLLFLTTVLDSARYKNPWHRRRPSHCRLWLG
jgi:hypothetical protein